MEFSPHLSGACLSVAFLALLQVSCDRREIEVYTVEKGKESEPATPVATATNAVRLPEPAPERWEPKDPSGGPRVASFRVAAAEEGAEAADMGVTVFPGAAGGILANVNRWLGEMGQAHVTQDQLTNVVQNGEHEIHIVDAESSERRTLGAILPLAKETWFFKLTGPLEVVSAQRDAFLEYLDGVEIRSPSETENPTLENQPDRPKIAYKKPDGWVEGESNSMRVASFSVPGPDGFDADVAVTPLGSASAAKLANINMWRTSVRLDGVTADQLAEIVQTIDISGREFQLVNFESEEPMFDDDLKNRIIVAFATVGDHTWYFKIAGESKLVAAQHPVLLEFLKSVEFASEK